MGKPEIHSDEVSCSHLFCFFNFSLLSQDMQKKREQELEELQRTLSELTSNLDRLRFQAKTYNLKSKEVCCLGSYGFPI
jgi:hypothetical protein